MIESTRIWNGVTALAAASLVTLAAPALAQDGPACSFRGPHGELTERASPPDSTSVELEGGMAKICFSSPRMRGREIMGGLVPFDQPWRLGANEPTTLHATVAVELGDVSLDPGAYALYAIPGGEQWEIVVNSAVDRWGIPISDEVRQHDVGSVAVAPETLSEDVEAMDIRLEPQDGGGAHLVIEWERTRLSVPVEAASMEDEGGEY